MYDELIKRLREHNGWALNETLDEAADAIENMSEAYSKLSRHMDDLAALMPRWIPVTERLPGIDDGDWVLGVANGFACGIVYKNAIVTVEYYENSGCWSLHDLDAKVTVTHWMPLPEPPEEEEQDNG